MEKSTTVLTDSGGVFKRRLLAGAMPVLVMRDTTERPEAPWQYGETGRYGL